MCSLVVVSAEGFIVWRDWTSRTDAQTIRNRAAELANRALAQDSALSCLAGDLGEAVETACERVVFAKPETTAAAVTYTAARMSLIADGLDYAKRSDPAFADTLNGVRRAIELDRFGLAAQVLSTRDGCTVDRCAFYSLTRDPSALKANIKARAYETYVARYAGGWMGEEKAPVAEKTPEAAPPQVSAAPEASPPQAPVASKYNFPSAASIPPVSIMNAEPPLPWPSPQGAAAAVLRS